MLRVAAASVTAVSLADVAKLAGILPDFSKPAAPVELAVTPPQPAKPIEAHAPIAAAELAPPPMVETKPEPAATKAERVVPAPANAEPALGNAPPPAERAGRLADAGLSSAAC